MEVNNTTPPPPLLQPSSVSLDFPRMVRIRVKPKCGIMGAYKGAWDIQRGGVPHSRQVTPSVCRIINTMMVSVAKKCFIR